MTLENCWGYNYFFLNRNISKKPIPNPIKSSAATCPIRIPTPSPISKHAGMAIPLRLCFFIFYNKEKKYLNLFYFQSFHDFVKFFINHVEIIRTFIIFFCETIITVNWFR